MNFLRILFLGILANGLA